MAQLAQTRASRHQTAWLLAVVGVLAALAALAHPAAGIPAAAGVAAFAAVRLSQPDKILRGRTLSPSGRRRAAALAGLGMLALAGLLSGAAAALQAALALELRLRTQIEAAQTQGEVRLGGKFEACAPIACARATVIRLPHGHTLGLARMGGFALHDEAPFGWRGAAANAARAAPAAGP
jgi:hypothetical protein